jgi:serine/threonine protein kinase
VTDERFAQGLVGVTLDERYRLDAVLGEGGMGAVFRATQLAMDRKVAVKLLKPHLTSDQAALQRFAREARATRKVDSPHAVKILDFGVTPLGHYYMVLEYLDGRTVQRELEIDGPFAPARVARIARQALSALGAAHDQGLIHRDVKPDNLLLMRVGSDADYTKILDFGVAKLMQGAAADRSQLALTAAGMVFGTPEFMSPEQACGQALDGRSDLYSLAATMFVMVTGTGLFEGKTALEWLTHQASTPAPRLALVRPELTAYPELDDLLQRCLAKHRDQRPGTAAEMAALIAALEPTLLRAPTAAPRRDTPASRQVAAAVTPATRFHVSSYFQPLLDAGPPGLAPEVAANRVGLAPTVDLPSLPSALPPAPPAPPPATKPFRRGLYFWLGGAAIASLLGGAIGIVIRTSGSQNTSIPAAEPASAPHEVIVAAEPADETEPVDAATLATAKPSDTTTTTMPPLDAGPAVVPRDAPPVPSSHGPAPVRNARAEEHLRNAEDAFRRNNQLKQLAEADLALRADPRSVRAKYLLGDALLKGGDLDRGCAYLHALKRNQVAHDRARAAGCPDD